MNPFGSSPRPIRALAMAFVLFIIPVYGQTSSPCTASMLSTLTPCMNFLTNTTANITSPTPGCCTSLNSLASSGMGCLCLVVNGNVPLPMTINRTLAIALPTACNMPPVQCKALSAPLPAPGAAPLPAPGTVFSPALSPGVSPSTSPQFPSELPPSQAPEDSHTVLTPPSSGPVLAPSGAMASYSISAYLLFSLLAFAILKIY